VTCCCSSQHPWRTWSTPTSSRCPRCELCCEL
jgi:hypothetical protein